MGKKVSLVVLVVFFLLTSISTSVVDALGDSTDSPEYGWNGDIWIEDFDDGNMTGWSAWDANTADGEYYWGSNNDYPAHLDVARW